MKPPALTEQGLYWVKYQGVWGPAFVWNDSGYWLVDLIGTSQHFRSEHCDELGPKLEPPKNNDASRGIDGS